MTGPLGTADFFALEAGECLDRLETLATRPDGVPADDFLRAARALRGSALMAGRQPIARAAAALELLARAVRDQRRPWDAAARERSLIAVEELRALVRRGREWSDADTARADRLAHDLEGLVGRRVPESPARIAARTESAELTPGVRAFVARECTLVAAALDRAARTARSDAAQREPLYEVLRRMQSLRGLAELGELSPLPEILDGLELALGDLTRLFAPPPEAPSVLEAAARALARVSREVAEDGRPTPDAHDAREFTDLLLRAFAAETDVVPIESLFADGDGEPIRRGALDPAFEPPGPLGAIELLSHGEHLYQIADQIERARSRTERDLRLYGLVAPLRSLATGGDSPVRAGLVAFAEAARTQIARGAATARPGVFADILREAGALLRAAAGRGEADDPMARLLALAERLEAVGADEAGEADEPGRVAEAPAAGARLPEEPAAEAGEPQLPDEIVPIQALAYAGEPMIVEWGSAPTDDEEPVAADAGADREAAGEPEPLQQPVQPDVVPATVELAEPAPEITAPWSEPTAPHESSDRPDAVVPIESLAPAGHEVPGPLEASWASYERLVDRAAPAAPTAPTAPSAPVGLTEPAAAIVEIGTLLYRGRGALERAGAVRSELADALRRDTPLTELRPLVEELVDLVPLALE